MLRNFDWKNLHEKQTENLYPLSNSNYTRKFANSFRTGEKVLTILTYWLQCSMKNVRKIL